MSDAPVDAPFTTLCRDTEGALMLRFEHPPEAFAFEAFAFDLARRLGAKVGERIDTAEASLWRLGIGDEELTLLRSAEQGTYLVAYAASAEPLVEKAHALFAGIAKRIAEPRD